MYVCICRGVTDHAIHDARARGVVSIEQLGIETGCGLTCGACRPLAAELLNGADRLIESHNPFLTRCRSADATA